MPSRIREDHRLLVSTSRLMTKNDLANEGPAFRLKFSFSGSYEPDLTLIDIVNVCQRFRKKDIKVLRLLSDFTAIKHAEQARSLVLNELLDSEDYETRFDCLFGGLWKAHLSTSDELIAHRLISKRQFSSAAELMISKLRAYQIKAILKKLPHEKWLQMYRALKHNERFRRREWHELSRGITVDLVNRAVEHPEEIAGEISMVNTCIAVGQISKYSWLSYLGRGAIPRTVESAFADACRLNDLETCRYIVRERFDCVIRSFCAEKLKFIEDTPHGQSKAFIQKLTPLFSLHELSSAERTFVLAIKDDNRSKIKHILERIPWILESFHKELLELAEVLHHYNIFSQLASFERLRPDLDEDTT